jgi:hypothetical protein
MNYLRHRISLQGKIMLKDSKRQGVDTQLLGRRWLGCAICGGRVEATVPILRPTD